MFQAKRNAFCLAGVLAHLSYLNVSANVPEKYEENKKLFLVLWRVFTRFC